MILFVFEGAKCEPQIFDTLSSLFFEGRKDDIICCYNSNIYSLYDVIKRDYSDFENEVKDGFDLVPILVERKRNDNDNPFAVIKDFSEIEAIYLFFDYDYQQVFRCQKEDPSLDLGDLLRAQNEKLKKLIEFFDNETSTGKLYINYPMVESVYYTRELPDANFTSYTTTLETCKNHCFKKECENFTFYKGHSKLIKQSDGNVTDELRKNWLLIKEQHVKKANYICTNATEIPKDKSVVSQQCIFANQLDKYVNADSEHRVAILSAFPMFLFEYFKQ